MNFLQTSITLKISCTKLRVDFVCDVDQNTDLKIELVHILHFILHFECKFFDKSMHETMVSFGMSFKKALNSYSIP